MDIQNALAFALEQRRSVLVTIKRDGHPQLSNVLHVIGDDGTIRVSITATRAKYHNLVRTPWAAMHVTSADFWQYAVLECDVELSAVAAAPDDAVWFTEISAGKLGRLRDGRVREFPLPRANAAPVIRRVAMRTATCSCSCSPRPAACWR